MPLSWFARKSGVALESAVIFLDIGGADASGKKTAPSEFRIFAKGKHTTDNGEYTFDDASAKSVMAEYQTRGNRIPLDYCHGMLDDKPVDPELSGKAAGFCDLEVRDGDLWATNIEWTPSAKKHLEDGEYLQFSPAFVHKKGHVERLVNIALTNIPATFDQEPLAASRSFDDEPQETTMKTLLTRLGLNDSATEAEAVEALAKLQTERKELLTLTGREKLTEALGVVHGWKEAAEKFSKADEELKVLKREAKDRKARRVVLSAIKSGALPPSMKKKAMKLARKSPELLSGFLDTFKGLKKGKKTHKEPADTGEIIQVELTARDKKAIELSGVDPKAYAQAKLAGIKACEAEARGED